MKIVPYLMIKLSSWYSLQVKIRFNQTIRNSTLNMKFCPLIEELLAWGPTIKYCNF